MDDVGTEHHTGSTAERVVVDGFMPVGRVVADVVKIDREEARILRTLEDALGERPGEHAGKERQDVELDHAGTPAYRRKAVGALLRFIGKDWRAVGS
jgi:hypothetical protein